MMNSLGIVAALEPEVQAILKNEHFCWQLIDDNLYYSKKNNIHLVISGIGKVFAVYALAKIINKVNTVFTIGTSGGLADEKIGSIYLSTEFVEHDMDASGLGFTEGVTPFSDMQNAVISNCSEKTESYVQTACKNLGIDLKYGRTISGDQFLANPEITKTKKDLFKADLVDMESAAIAKICSKEKKDFLALRYITDNANHDSKTDWNENVKKSSLIFNNILKEIAK